MEQAEITAVVLQVIRATNSRNAKQVMAEIKRELPSISEEKIKVALRELWEKTK